MKCVAGKTKRHHYSQGAKTKHYQIISAVLLTEEVTIKNIPDIIDVNLLIDLLAEMNVKVNRISRDTCILKADEVDVDTCTAKPIIKSGKLRGSVMLAGPMLARFKKPIYQKPVAIKLARRRLIRIIGFENWC